MPKRIVAFNWTDIKHPSAGGAEQMSHQHFVDWVKHGYEVTQITAWAPGLARTEVVDGITIYRRATRTTLWAVGWYYFFTLLRGRADLIVDQFHGMPYFSPIWFRGPKIALIHEVPDVIWDKLYPFPLNWLGRFLDWFNLLFYRHIPFWTISPSTRADLVRYGIPGKQIHVIYCGANLTTLEQPAQKYTDLTLLSVNRISKMKGIEDVLDAFRLVLAEEPKASLVVAGRGEEKYERYLKNKVETMGIATSVTFTGFIDEKTKVDFYQKAHILVHASVKEGWGLNIIEANTQGTPAIVYDVSGLRDSVSDGVSGIICKKNTPGELAKNVLSLWNDKREYSRLQFSALKYSKKYSWAKATGESLEMVKKYLKE